MPAGTDEARATFHEHGLANVLMITQGTDQFLFPWKSDATLSTLRLLLDQYGLRAELSGAVVLVRDCARERLREIARRLAATPAPDPLELAARVPSKEADKHDHYLPTDLMNRAYAARAIDVPGAMTFLREAASSRE